MNDYKGAALLIRRYKQMFSEMKYEFDNELRKYIGDKCDYNVWLLTEPTVWVYVQGDDGNVIKENGVRFIEIGEIREEEVE